jgi:N-acyl amino acid synthase of PEP-CTERM/exosortase system
MNQLSKSFYEYFEILQADSESLREQAYRLRYEVLCLEKNLPGFDQNPENLESDKYDRFSIQSVMRYRATGEVVGTVRLILHDPDDLRYQFPLEINTGRYFDKKSVDPSTLPRKNTAEISRLLLSRKFRSRSGESHYPHGGLGADKFHAPELRRTPQPFLGLVAAIIRMTAMNSITHWYAGMEPTLNSSLKRFGLDLMPIGPVCSYHGMRQPYLGIVDDVLTSAYFKDRSVWEFLTEEGTLWAPPKDALAAQLRAGN